MVGLFRCLFSGWLTVTHSGHLFNRAIAVELVRGNFQIFFRKSTVEPEDHVKARYCVDLNKGGYEEADCIGYREENDVNQIELHKRDDQRSQDDKSDSADVGEFVCFSDVDRIVDNSLPLGRLRRAEAVGLSERIAALMPDEFKVLKFFSSTFGVLAQQVQEENDKERIEQGDIC